MTFGAGSGQPIRTVRNASPVTEKRQVTPGGEPAPGGNDGFFVGCFWMAALRIRTTGGTPSYDLRIFTRDREPGSQFIEDPTEARTGLTADYTRFFRTGPITENIAVQIVANNTNTFIEWSAA